jgi:hypothetical protein
MKSRKPPFKGYVGLLHTLPLTDKRLPKYERQLKTRGFDDTELWNLDVTFAKFMLPRFKEFRKNDGRPYTYTKRQWHRKLDQVERALTLISLRSWDLSPNETRVVQKGLAVFGEICTKLWT